MSYIRHIEGRFKQGKTDEAARKVVDFYNGLIGKKTKGLRGFIMTGSLDDPKVHCKVLIIIRNIHLVSVYVILNLNAYLPSA